MNEQLSRFQSVIDRLIDPEKGCPWDKEQTPLSLCEYLIEECHELVAAIRADKPGHACDEMGDLLFVLLLIARRFELSGAFSLEDALKIGADKMIRRHPHVFGDAKVVDEAQMKKDWLAIKKEEKASSSDQGILSSVPPSLPPLTRAYRLHAKAASCGFTWDEDEEVERQVEAEWLELLDARASQGKEAQAHELGDMLFTLTELGRRMGVKASEALDLTCNRFQKRFSDMEDFARQDGKDFQALNLDEKDELWNRAKAEEPDANRNPSVDFAEPKEIPGD